jgi:hypothetical protein
MIYSTRLLEGFRVTHQTLVAAPGFVTVVRDIDIFWPTAGGGLDVFVVGTLGQGIVYFHAAGAAPSQMFQWRGRQVMNGGDSWNIFASSVIDITISGYQLS